MWAQTYKNGNRYYREQKGSRGSGYCVDRSSSTPCDVPDNQVGRIVQAIVLPEAWMGRVLAHIHLADDEVATTRAGSGIALINQTPQTQDEPEASESCSWWRRGRVHWTQSRNGLGGLI